VSLIEALAAGRAVVATRVGGVPDVVRDGATGFLVPPRDPDAFAAACVRLLEEPTLRSEFGALGRQEVAGRFGAERLVTDMQALYEELLARR
jgi:glycosyltransferase involved in cell wall biosynthesis